MTMTCSLFFMLYIPWGDNQYFIKFTDCKPLKTKTNWVDYFLLLFYIDVSNNKLISNVNISWMQLK